MQEGNCKRTATYYQQPKCEVWKIFFSMSTSWDLSCLCCLNKQHARGVYCYMEVLVFFSEKNEPKVWSYISGTCCIKSEHVALLNYPRRDTCRWICGWRRLVPFPLRKSPDAVVQGWILCPPLTMHTFFISGTTATGFAGAEGSLSSLRVQMDASGE